MRFSQPTAISQNRKSTMTLPSSSHLPRRRYPLHYSMKGTRRGLVAVLVGFIAGLLVVRPQMLATCQQHQASALSSSSASPPPPLATLLSAPTPLRAVQTPDTPDDMPHSWNTVDIPITTIPLQGNFTRHDGVVIVTQIHGLAHVEQLKQSLCLLQTAYNSLLQYDIVIFTTLPLTDYETTELQDTESVTAI